MFSTVRPGDYSLPYATLEKNNVAFTALDKRGNKLLTIMVGGSRWQCELHGFGRVGFVSLAIRHMM